MSVVRWTEEEIALLRSAYALPIVDLAALAALIGRNKANVCRKARALGLTDQSRPRVLQRKERLRKFADPAERRAHQGRVVRDRIAKNGHPRGALGMRHTPEARAKIAAASRRAWADPASGLNADANRQRLSDRMIARVVGGTMRSGYSRSAGGRRADLDDRYFRSAWEANYARYLRFRTERGELLRWEFEPKTFVFKKITRGTRAYTPDFRLTFPDGRVEWHEVKGWMDPKSKTRLRRMAKYYPAEVVRVIDEKWFREASRSGLAATLPGWERGQGRGARGC